MDWREIVVIIVAVALVAFALATPFVRSYKRKKGKGGGCCGGGTCSSCGCGSCPYCGDKEHEQKEGERHKN